MNTTHKHFYSIAIGFKKQMLKVLYLSSVTETFFLMTNQWEIILNGKVSLGYRRREEIGTLNKSKVNTSLILHESSQY